MALWSNSKVEDLNSGSWFSWFCWFSFSLLNQGQFYTLIHDWTTAAVRTGNRRSALKDKGYKSWVLNKQALTHNCFAVSALWPVKGVTLGSCTCCAQKPLEGPLILPVLPVSLWWCGTSDLEVHFLPTIWEIYIQFLAYVFAQYIKEEEEEFVLFLTTCVCL